jgi:hypothetical protein
MRQGSVYARKEGSIAYSGRACFFCLVIVVSAAGDRQLEREAPGAIVPYCFHASES